ncbi:MAG: hypothetical protein WCJ58_05515 [bacterium]
MENHCVFCQEKANNLYGILICDTCKAKLGLFSDATIKKHIELYANSEKNRSYEEEIRYRLKFIEADYLKKKIKLLHILARLESL